MINQWSPFVHFLILKKDVYFFRTCYITENSYMQCEWLLRYIEINFLNQKGETIHLRKMAQAGTQVLTVATKIAKCLDGIHDIDITRGLTEKDVKDKTLRSKLNRYIRMKDDLQECLTFMNGQFQGIIPSSTSSGTQAQGYSNKIQLAGGTQQCGLPENNTTCVMDINVPFANKVCIGKTEPPPLTPSASVIEKLKEYDWESHTGGEPTQGKAAKRHKTYSHRRACGTHQNERKEIQGKGIDRCVSSTKRRSHRQVGFVHVIFSLDLFKRGYGMIRDYITRCKKAWV